MSVPGEKRPLHGHRILVVEDELIIALDVVEALERAGAAVVGPCAVLPPALQAAEQEDLSGAILDVRLGKSTTSEIAQVLQRRGIPYLICSGQRAAEIREEFVATGPIIEKPVSEVQLLQALTGMLNEPRPSP